MAFIFGTDSRNGRKSVDVIKDDQLGEDVIGLEGDESVRSVVEKGSAIMITLIGDGDRIIINGAALNVAEIQVVHDNFAFL